MSEAIVSLDRHPILMQAYEVSQAIESCGASVELTNASIKSSELLESLKGLVVVHEAIKAELKAGFLEYYDLHEALSQAVTYLKEGKAKFTPNTTNSFVDDFIAKWENGAKDERN